MHYLIRVIVKAENQTDANDEARRLLYDLVEGGEFDWFNELPEHSRWQDCWKPLRLTTKKAMTLINSAMADQLTDFNNGMAAVREMLSRYSDEQIFNEQFDRTSDKQYLSRYCLTQVGGHHGGYIFADDWGSIVNQRELDMLLKDKADWWVVPVDCHR